ncbi:CPBP family intramembrane glutamic endopeptidase [Crateriforma conspicua]|uniref:CAAX amino terminal protease self-immunity n=1 Tax=Crateriforma conspicua TaxID=2527996 RepID=A0A5C6FNW5_9PLAN|nr:type II CAAX endopeptidase family protein [Crateriforma conspicua]TWU62186.1 CAAX amino terminal protease self- immunity [Crateriforma conspicua]
MNDQTTAGNESTPARVWPVIVLTIVAFIAVILAQIVASLAVLFATKGSNETFAEAAGGLQQKMFEAPNFVFSIAVSGIPLIVVGLTGGWFSAMRQGARLKTRLGLSVPNISATTWLAFVLGSVPVFLVALLPAAAISQWIPGNEGILDLYRNANLLWAIVMVAVVGVVPGVSEELFFRGFVQRRLLKRYSPAVAIGMTSVLFGLIHVAPQSIALAIVMGVWLGVIAWRTDSIWPSALCHTFVNSGWNAYQFGRLRLGWPDIPSIWVGIVAGTLLVIAFVWSCRWLSRRSVWNDAPT